MIACQASESAISYEVTSVGSVLQLIGCSISHGHLWNWPLTWPTSSCQPRGHRSHVHNIQSVSCVVNATHTVSRCLSNDEVRLRGSFSRSEVYSFIVFFSKFKYKFRLRFRLVVREIVHVKHECGTLVRTVIGRLTLTFSSIGPISQFSLF